MLIAADRREFSGFDNLEFHSTDGVRNLAETQLKHVPAVLAANGVGRQAASAATRSLLLSHPISTVISTGFAGALDPTFAVGDTFVADRISAADVEYSGGLPMSPDSQVRRGTLVTVDHVVQTAAEKRRLAASGAHAVDMEASAVAKVAAEHGLPYYCVRAISDTDDTTFAIDFNRALRADGTFSITSIVAQAGLSSRRWQHLLQLKRDGETAARSLARFLSTCEFKPA